MTPFSATATAVLPSDNSLAHPSIVPTTVWTDLSIDLQLHAIQLLAQLACICAAEQFERPDLEKAHGPE